MSDDFGFSGIQRPQPVQSQYLDSRARKIRDLVVPFLENLKKGGDNIKWPKEKREAALDELIEKINDLVDNK